MPVGTSSFNPQLPNKNTDSGSGIGKFNLTSSSTTSVGYDPTKDLAQKRAEMEKVYGSGDESFATKLIASRQKQRERTAKTQFGLTPEEMEAGNMPEQGAEGGLYGDKLDLYDEMEETKNNLSNMYKERLKVLQGYKDKAGNKVAGSLDRIQNSLTQAEQEVQKAFQEIKNADLDPMKGVPMWAIALIGLGAGLQEIGRKGAGNATVGVLNSVIKQRQEQKRLELQKLFDVHKLSSQQREYLSEIFERRLSEQSNLMKNIAIMDEAKLAIREKSLDYQITVADKINALAASKAEDQFAVRSKGLEEMSKAKDFEIKSKIATASKTTSGSREQLVKLGDSSKKEKKRLPAKFSSELAADLITMKKFERLANLVKGKNLTPIKKMLAVFGTDAGRIMPKVTAMARMIGRHNGVDKGNFAEKEGAVMVEAITGKDWNKAQNAYNNLIEEYNDAVDTWQNKVQALSYNYDVSGLMSLKKPVKAILEPTESKRSAVKRKK